MSERTREWLFTEDGEAARKEAEKCNELLARRGLYMDVNDPNFPVCCAQCHDVFPECLGWCGK